MLRTTALLFIALLILPYAAVVESSAFAQQPENPPNYRLQVFGYNASADGSQIVIRFGVSNIGGDAARTASVVVTDLSNGAEIAQESGLVRPLQGGGDTEGDLSIAFPVTTFPSGSNQVLNVEVGIGEIETNDSPTVFNNSVSISVEIPDYRTEVVQPNSTPFPTRNTNNSNIITVPGLDLEIDTTDSEQMIIVVGIIISVVVMLIILYMIIRLLLRRPPTFGNWQPPYATMPPLDPNSTYGRRQMWQQHAANNIVPSPCAMGSIHARKLLLGMDAEYLSGWKVIALRLSQYDMYGRVSRSQVLAAGGLVKKLDRVAHRTSSLTVQKVIRRVRPISRKLARQLRKKIKKRGAMLPIALDVRLQGRHGEVRIVFELHECRNNRPYMLDSWEPEMTVLGKTIHDSYTFTIHGQVGGETFKAFKRRLSDDIERVLVEFLRTGIPVPAPDTTQQTNSQQSVHSFASDTTSAAPMPPDSPRSDTDTQTVGG